VRRVIIVISLITFLIASTPIPGHALFSMGCPASPATMLTVLTNSMATLYNVLPIKIGAIPIAPFPDAYETKSSWPLPICFCLRPPLLIPFPGLAISYWEPIEGYEVVKIPFCFPALGFDIPITQAVSRGLLAGEDADSLSNGKHQAAFAQVHQLTYEVWRVIRLFTDFVCLTPMGEIDVSYITEVDPFWQNDLLNAILNDPATLLFANPIAQLACIVDAARAALPKAGKPIDMLFWCMGSWGSVYPVTGHTADEQGYTCGNLAIANKQLYRSLTGKIITTGKPTVTGSCQPYIKPFWKKSQYSWLQLFPVVMGKRMPIGRASITWSYLKNPPVPGKCDHFVWMLYRKRECCAF